VTRPGAVTRAPALRLRRRTSSALSHLVRAVAPRPRCRTSSAPAHTVRASAHRAVLAHPSGRVRWLAGLCDRRFGCDSPAEWRRRTPAAPSHSGPAGVLPPAVTPGLLSHPDRAAARPSGRRTASGAAARAVRGAMARGAVRQAIWRVTARAERSRRTLSRPSHSIRAVAPLSWRRTAGGTAAPVVRGVRTCRPVRRTVRGAAAGPRGPRRPGRLTETGVFERLFE
jgi:hypothetical protein